jgi:prolyl-tRNA synthetase
MILRPNGYAIWQMIQKSLDKTFCDIGVENVYMPLLIPENLLNKEKDHIEGFAPEVAWVTHGGKEKLNEKLCIRPTSETLFCEHYKSIISSYRDLPKTYNQWCNVVRWEKNTRPFLRTSEFLWQEGHTVHENLEQAHEMTLKMLNLYKDFFKNYLALPAITGKKTDNEKFAGAIETYSLESLMLDGQALQVGTSHNFGDNFARAFDIKFSDKNNKLKYVFQTSFGVSTRLIGAIIMTHGDDNGLVLPPKIAPIQVIIIPINFFKDKNILEKSYKISDDLNSIGLRNKIDVSEKSPGWKFNEYELRGVPLRLEIGPNDIKNNKILISRRDNSKKYNIAIRDAYKIKDIVEEMQREMFLKAEKFLTENISYAENIDEFKEILKNKSGFIKSSWCSNSDCEKFVKDNFNITPRCIEFKNNLINREKISKCIICGEESNDNVFWARAY